MKLGGYVSEVRRYLMKVPIYDLLVNLCVQPDEFEHSQHLYSD